MTNAWEQFLFEFREKVGLWENEVTLLEETEFRKIPKWDSLAEMSLIVLINLKYDKPYDAAALKKCITMKDLFLLCTK